MSSTNGRSIGSLTVGILLACGGAVGLGCIAALAHASPAPPVVMIDLPARPVIAPVVECDSLAHLDFSEVPGAPTSIVSAALEGANGDRPEFCVVKGYVAPQVQFELHLPTRTYTGRYLQGGCGGACGRIFDQFAPACDTGRAFAGAFAVGFENSGHVGASPIDTIWAAGNPAGRIDFAYRAAHVTALAAKALIGAFYGKPPAVSYFQGCSNGGREGLMEAQRYALDFNGIVAGAPAVWITPGALRIIWETKTATGPDQQPLLSASAVALLHAAVMKACDGVDGLRDGQIDDPRACRYDPRKLICRTGHAMTDCISAQQAEVMRRLYRGPTDDQGRLLYLGGEPYGSELTWLGPASLTRIGSSLAGRQIKYMIFDGDPPKGFDWDTWQFDAARLRTLIEKGGYYDASDANIGAFRDAGGKLILWQGAADSPAGPNVLLDYYQRMRDVGGGLQKVREFARLFIVPGTYHCSGGYVAYQEDLLGAVVSWVERGTVPEKVVAAAILADGTPRTRPIFAYPVRARYTGKGSINDAANFIPSSPSKEPDDHFAWLGAQMTSGAEPAAEVAHGDLHPTYVMPETGQVMTYRLHIPPTYDGSKAVGLVVVLHGYGGNEDSPFDHAPAPLQGILQREADRHAFIVVAPAGYDGHGDYGAHLRLPMVAGRDIPHSARSDDLALADVMSVVDRVMRDYRIDRKRVYLMGNSMGMTGVLYLAQKLPGMWCAIGPSDGPPWEDYPVKRLEYLAGAFFVNGANDHLALSAENRKLAERVRAVGVETRFVDVPNGEHGTAWYLALPEMFDFFAAHHCRN